MNGALQIAIAVLSLASLTVYFALILRKTFLQTLILSIGFIVAVLFLFGMLNFRGCLELGYVVILVLSVIAGACSGYKIYKNKRVLKNTHIVYGLTLFVLFLVLSAVWNYGRLLQPGDEFTHWGVVVKHMYLFDAFGTIPESTILLKGYLPGISLFQYFFVAIGRDFIDYPLYIAINTLFFAILAALMPKLHATRKALFIGIFIAVPLLFTDSFNYLFINALSVDVIMSALFAFCIISILTRSEKIIVYDILMVATGCFLLTTSKDTGIILTAICLAVYTFDTTIFHGSRLKQIIGAHSRKKNVKNVFLLALPLIGAISAWGLWKTNVRINKVQPWFDASSINLANFATNNLQPYQRETVSNFVERSLFGGISAFNVSFTAIMTFFLIAILALSMIQKDRMFTKRLIYTGFTVFVGALVYLAMLLILYMFVFSPTEAVAVASYDRYVATYAVGSLLILLAVMLQRSERVESEVRGASKNFILLRRYAATYGKKRYLVFILVAIVAIIAIGKTIHIRGYYLQYIKPHTIAVNGMVDQESAGRWLRCLSNADDRMYILSYKDGGSRDAQLRYVFYGTGVYIPKDISSPVNTRKAPPPFEATWSQHVLKDFSLVYLDQYDNEFQERYGIYFDSLKEGQLYRIVKDGDKTELRTISSIDCAIVTKALN
jgi:hypothetical protein